MYYIMSLCSNTPFCFSQGEVEISGSFDDVSRSPLFAELLQEEEQPEEPKSHHRQRTLSIQVGKQSVRTTLHNLYINNYCPRANSVMIFFF